MLKPVKTRGRVVPDQAATPPPRSGDTCCAVAAPRARILGRLAAKFVVLWASQLQIERIGWEHVGNLERSNRPVIYVVWHGSQLVPLACFRKRGITIMTSLSLDGEIQTCSLQCLGYRTVRGSSSRGGARALLAMVRALRDGHQVSMTVDGPRGPYHQVKPGAVMLAQKAQALVVPVSVGYRYHHALTNWDRFEIPLPFSRACLVCGAPFVIPADMPLDQGCRLIEKHLLEGDQLAARSALI